MTTSPDKLLSIARESGGAVHDMGRGLYAVTFGEVSLPEFVERIRPEQQELIDRLRLEAQTHAQEARTQRATVHEIYRLVTGGTGEPGDWNGAEPVRRAFERIRQDEREKVRELLTEAVDFWQTYSSMSEQYQDDMAAERNAMLEKMEDAIRSISTSESEDDTH
jgi:hypothetical protein